MAQNEWAVVSETPIARTAGTGWEVVEQKPTTGAFAAGVKSYLPQVQETFGGLKTLLGVGAERVLGEGQISRGLIESGAASMKEAEAKRQPFMTAERGSFTDALNKGVGTVLTEWLPYQAGSGAAQLVEALALVGAGGLAGTMTAPGPGTLAGAGTGLVARELAKRGVKEAAEKILKERGEDAAKVYFEKAAKDVALDIGKKRGQTAALAGQAAFYGTGQTTSRAVEEAEKLGGTATDIELARVLPAAAVSTVAEFIGDKIALGALKGIKPGEPGKFVAADLAKNILLNIGLTGTKEVPVEVIQSAAERFGAKLSLTDAQALKEYIDATASSYGMAVAPGVGGGVRQTMAERAKPAPEMPPAPPVAPPAAEVPPVTPEVEAPPVAEVPPAPTSVTPEFLTELGIKPTAAVARRIKGKSLDDPAVATELETYANKYASEESKPKILEFVQSLKPPVEPAVEAPAAPVAETPVTPVTETPVTPTVETPVAATPPTILAAPAAPVAETPPVETTPPTGKVPPVEPVVEAAAPSRDFLSRDVDDVTTLPIPNTFGGAPTENRLFHGGTWGGAIADKQGVVIDGVPATSFTRNPFEALEYASQPGGKVVSASSENLKIYTGDDAELNEKYQKEGASVVKNAGYDGIDLRALYGGGYNEVVVWNTGALQDVKSAPVKNVADGIELEKNFEPITPPAAPTVEPAAPKAEAPTAKSAKSAALRKQPNTVMGSTMLADVSNRLGGLDLSLLSEFSTKFITKRKDKYGRPLTMWRNPMVPGVGTLFRKGGESDYVLIATMLEEAGYLEPGSVERDYKEAGERAKDMIKAALNREEVLTLEQQESQRQTDEEANRQAWLEQQEELKAERDNAAREAGLTPYEGDLLTDEDIDVFAPAKPQTDEQYAAGMRGLGFDETEIADAVQKKQERERAQKTASGRPAEARAVPEIGEGTEGLERYTSEEVTRKQEEAEKAAAEEKKAKAAEQARLQKEQREKEEKARADESVKDFELGKSAEEQMTGMGDLFKVEKKSLGGERAQVQAFEQTLRNLLNKFGLKDVGLKILDGMTDSGSYAAQIIRIAADAANPVRTLRHEAIHALRELGFFTDAQWSSLSKMAKDKWIDQYLKQRNVDGKPLKAGEESRYDAYMREYNGDMEKITEEAVSDAFADFDATKPPAGMLQALLKRMKDLFQSIKSALTKVESPEQIFGKVEKGELKAGKKTEAGERKSVGIEAQPKFKEDLGSPSWLQEQIDYAKERGRDRWGVPYMGKTTGSFKGDISVPMSLLEKLRGQRGEQQAVREESLDYIRKNWDEVSKEPPYIEVAYNGEAWISEGNHRIMVAKEKGLNILPVEIKYFDGGQKVDGPLKPEKLLDIRKSIGGRNPGEQAISIVNQMKMGIPPAKPTFGQQTIAILKGEQQLPTLDLKTAKEVAMKFSDTFEKNIFSADAAFENAVRRGVREAVKDNDKVIGLVLQAGQSQTVNIDNVVSRAIIEGASEYNEDMQKWQSVQKKENLKAQTAKLEEISKKYNLPLDEVKSVAHAYLVTKRLPGILERNAKFTAEIEAEKKTAKPDRKKIEELQALLVYVSPTQKAQMEPGQSLVKLIPELEQVSDIWQGMRKNTIKTMVEGGLWSEEYAESMLDNVDYVPYYRVEQLEEDAGPLEFVRGLQVKSKEHRLKGADSPVNDVFDNQVRWMQYAMSRTMRAHKARQMIDVAKDIDIGGRKMAVKVTEQERGMNIVRIYRDGKQEMWDVADPNFIDAFAAIQNVSIPMFKWAAKAAEILRNMVVLYPLFSVAQVPQDSFAAMFTSGLKPQHALKIPYLAVQEFIKTISKTSATHNELKKFGVVGARDFSADVMRKDAEIEAGLKQPKGVWGKTKEILEHVAMAGDNAVRQATYIASKQQGLSEKEALEKAFEIFNVRRRGTSKALNLAGQTIPFFYAYLAAQRVAYRTITGVGTSPTERMAALTTLAATSASVMVLSMIYAMMVGDDEDYAETPAAVRDRTLMIPGSGGVRIPLRPDFFLFPKIIAEHTYQLITDKGYEDGAKFRTSMFDALVNAVGSPTPIPQIVKPALEVAINYDFFQGKPLIGTFEKNKDLERQFRDTTSELAKLFGQTGMVSPIAVDHLIRGMLGSFGGLMLYGTNMFLHSDPDVPRPEMSWGEAAAALPGTAGFLKRPQESALKNDFFVLRDAVEKAANTFNDIKTRSPEGIEAFLEDEKNAIRLGMAKGVDKINRHLSDIRRRMTIITNMPESQMPADEKAENIRELRELEREILRSVNVKELREMAKI